MEKLRKVRQYRGFIIAVDENDFYHIFTKEEWSYGKGFRYPEHEAGSMQEAIDFIESY